MKAHFKFFLFLVLAASTTATFNAWADCSQNPGSVECMTCLTPEQIEYLNTCTGIVATLGDDTVTIDHQVKRLCSCGTETAVTTADLSCGTDVETNSLPGVFNACIHEDQIAAFEALGYRGTIENGMYVVNEPNSWTAPLCACQPVTAPRGSAPSETLITSPAVVLQPVSENENPAELVLCLTHAQDNRTVCANQNEIIEGQHADTYDPTIHAWFEIETGEANNWACYQKLNQLYQKGVIKQQLSLPELQQKIAPCLQQIATSWADGTAGSIQAFSGVLDSENQMIAPVEANTEPVFLMIAVDSAGMQDGTSAGCTLQAGQTGHASLTLTTLLCALLMLGAFRSLSHNPNQ